MNTFDRYIFKNLIIAAFFTAMTLTAVIFLTQSLRFLELVVESGASSKAFWTLTILAMPRFVEIVFPLSVMAATTFIYHRMTADSELIAIRATGYSPYALARPALTLALITTLALWATTMWVAPKSLSLMQETRQLVKAQFSSLLFREGVFNRVSNGLTVYIRSRTPDGELRGIMIHDSRAEAETPSTIMAQRGVMVSDGETYKIFVYDGSRQALNPETKKIQRLNFERYTIDFPNADPIMQRWKQPDERTIIELLNPDPANANDQENLRRFQIELHRRITLPLLAMAFTIISCIALLLGPSERRGQAKRIILAAGAVILLQGLYLATFNLARQSDLALPIMYALVLLPIGLGLFLLSGLSENLRRKSLFRQGARA